MMETYGSATRYPYQPFISGWKELAVNARFDFYRGRLDFEKAGNGVGVVINSVAGDGNERAKQVIVRVVVPHRRHRLPFLSQESLPLCAGSG
jgi:hypothetical protein